MTAQERQEGTTWEEIRIDHRQRYEQAAEWIRELTPWASSVLDAGCGVGYGSQYLAKRGYVVTAIDRDRATLEKAMKNFPGVELWIRANLEELTASETAHAAVALEVIEHLEHPEKFLAKMFSPVLIFSVPNASVYPLDRKRNPFHFKHYTYPEIKLLLNSHGYEIVRLNTQTADGTMRRDNKGHYYVGAAVKERVQGMMTFFDSNPQFAARVAPLKKRVAEASNACHDWCIANRHRYEGSFSAPEHLVSALEKAEEELESLRRSESNRYFTACREGLL